jgi:RimJ/RimL family protein N-acetyltransferase
MVDTSSPLEIPVLETERLIVRSLMMDDLNDCHRLFLDIKWADPHASDELNLQTRREWLEWTVRNYVELARLNQPPYGDRAVVLKSKQFVGQVGLVPSMGPFSQLPLFGGREDAPFSPEVGLFWAILPEFQERGFATEAARALVSYAFGTLRLGRIVATTQFDNQASIAVMRRLGMRIERNPYSEPKWFQIVGILDS